MRITSFLIVTQFEPFRQRDNIGFQRALIDLSSQVGYT